MIEVLATGVVLVAANEVERRAWDSTECEEVILDEGFSREAERGMFRLMKDMVGFF